jgi:hypothetical protein
MNSLSFEFVGIDLKNSDAVRYRWMLKGFEDNWSPEMDKHEATYSNLPSGKYTFLVKARNENEIWSKPMEYTFTIGTPFWKSVWFISNGQFTTCVD